ncbi:dGTPase [Saccharospirillum sp. MSK14-1]|uniref:dGTPase n=1 Tax=Saccharospirillum sp. MSK14-1 TaxID=1897632 RepID=UPI000D377082|nr:dGTPase [Saccharospirillum sp. MSK14-1]PTY37826.1 dGTPase [Saccharospirillum sp. MSK14-1]
MINFRDKLSQERPFLQKGQQPGIDHQGVDAKSIAQFEVALESDRGRIIQSAAVRRLQQKTQVFPLERNAAVRSRLTHSLEVQQNGRFLVRTVFDLLGKDAEQYGLAGLERALESLTEMACLMHDIGNPPFGHFGEAAISDWFARNLEAVPIFRLEASEAKALITELSSFEGNAQAIRLVSNLLKLNLTYSQAACILKYTRRATDERPEIGDPLSYLKKKPGYYLSEQPYVEALQHALNLEPGHRYPLAYLMEAADDIAYCLADIEDGVDKGILSYRQVADQLLDAFGERLPTDYRQSAFGDKSFRNIVDYAVQRADDEDINKDHQFFLWLRVQLIHPLVKHAAQAFVDHIEAIYHGHLNRALLEDDSPCHAVIETFKTVAAQSIFSVPEVETLELQGYTIINGLLDHYRPLLMLPMADFDRLCQGERKGLLVESLLFKRLPNKHVAAYHQLRKHPQTDAELWEAYCRCRLLQDMVSGMTDQFALEEYQTLSAL